MNTDNVPRIIVTSNFFEEKFLIQIQSMHIPMHTNKNNTKNNFHMKKQNKNKNKKYTDFFGGLRCHYILSFHQI